MGANWTMGLYKYFSDDGNTYNVALSDKVAQTGNFQPADSGAVANYPKQYRMRHITGIDIYTGNRHTNKVANASDTIFTSDSVFVYQLETYTIQGRIAEWRPGRL
jgi:hypothetical protein